MTTSTAAIVFFVVLCIQILARIILLGAGSYPRVVTWTRGEDAFVLALNIAVAVWLLLVLIR